jgi:hypothetical protein
MTEEVRLPRKLSEEPEAPRPLRPSHQKVIEQVERWANSPGLQPPKVQSRAGAAPMRAEPREERPWRLADR